VCMQNAKWWLITCSYYFSKEFSFSFSTSCPASELGIVQGQQ
jgi:hypothetical protein